MVFVNHPASRAEALRQIGAALEGTFYELKRRGLGTKGAAPSMSLEKSIRSLPDLSRESNFHKTILGIHSPSQQQRFGEHVAAGYLQRRWL